MNRLVNLSTYLPTYLRVNSAVIQLHRIGLTVRKSEKHLKRNFLCHPLLVATSIWTFTIRSIITLLFDRNNRQLFIYFGDFPYLTGITYHLNIGLFLWSLMNCIFQLI